MGARLRPKFELMIPETAERLLDRMAARLRSKESPLCGVVTPVRIELHVPPSRQHLWSPELRIDVQSASGGCRLVGTYGPHPHVWTLFVGIYAALGFGTFVALTFGLSQWLIGARASALYLLPLLLLGALGLRSLAFFGQDLGHDQMDELRAFLDEVVAEAEAPSSALPNGARLPA
jgi:hypothetical protein